MICLGISRENVRLDLFRVHEALATHRPGGRARARSSWIAYSATPRLRRSSSGSKVARVEMSHMGDKEADISERIMRAIR